MDLQFRIACIEAGEKIRITIDDQVIGTVNLPVTGGWQNWQTVTLDNVAIPEGSNQILKLEMLDSGFNLDWLNFLQE